MNLLNGRSKEKLTVTVYQSYFTSILLIKCSPIVSTKSDQNFNHFEQKLSILCLKNAFDAQSWESVFVHYHECQRY